jgi:3-hydroxyacyl-[acyl-carrier-protein] dehydratase
MRYVLIDRLTELVPHRKATAEKTFSRDEDFFRDHFPGFPVVPGALLTEAMSQTAGWLIAASLEFQSWPLLSMVQSAKYRRFVEAGETLRIEATTESAQATAWLMKTTITGGDRRIAEATLSFQIFPLSRAGEGQALFAGWTRDTFDALGGARIPQEAQ